MKYVFAIILAVAAALWWFMGTATVADAGQQSDLMLHLVKRQRLEISTVESGQLQAVKSHGVTADRGKIEWLIKEGDEVKAGDKVIELDANQFEEQIKKADTDIKLKKEDLEFLIANFPTEENIAQSWIEDARLKHETARESLRKFMQVDSFKNINKHEKAIEESEQKLDQALADLDKKQIQLDDSVFVEASVRARYEKEFQTVSKSVSTTRNQLEAATNERNLYKSRTYPKELKKLKRELERAELEVEKEKGRSRQSLANYKNKIANTEAQIERLEKQRNKAADSLKRCIVTAPVSGVVIYGDPKAGNQRWIRQNLKAGGQTYANYTLMTIPDMSQFSVQVPISEHARGRIAVGCQAEIEIPAIPGLLVKGSLTNISQLAKPRQSGNPSSPKVYTGTVELSEHDSRMVSGMTARVTLIGEIVDDALCVPVEAVFAEEGAYYCYVQRGNQAERQDIKLGRMNVFLVEVVSGLSEGDTVYVVEPTDAQQVAVE